MAIETGGLTYWFHESVSCLHDCMAMILQWRGQEPIAVLGAHWCFFHDPANVSTEEFYYPSRTGDLGRDLAPYHELGARWRLAPDSDALLGDICASLDDGRPALLVEDNFFMPNRPAFQDVHAAHLVLVTGYDSAAETLQIMEPTPPLYHGPISRAQLAQAVGSDNQARAQSRDFFFAGSKIAFIERQSAPGVMGGLMLQAINPKAYAVNTAFFSGFAFMPDSLARQACPASWSA